MSLANLFHFLCAQHVSDINISIIRSLRLSVELPHWSYCSWVNVYWSFGVVGLEWYPCCTLQPATRIPLQPNHTHRQISTVITWQPPNPGESVTVSTWCKSLNHLTFTPRACCKVDTYVVSQKKP